MPRRAKAPEISLLVLSNHRFARCFRITQPDPPGGGSGLVLRFTDHDMALTISGEVFTPIGSVSASAEQLTEGAAARNLDVRGVISSDAITEDDLRKGLWRLAKVEEFLVDWRYPEAGKFREAVYFIEEIKFDGELWEASLSSLVTKLRIRKGHNYTKKCRWRFGDANCGVDLELHQFTSTVSSILVPRRKFVVGGPKPEGWANDGKVVFTSGNMAGTQFDIATYEGGAIELRIETDLDVEVGDAVKVYAGCRHDPDACKGFNNFPRFGGFPYIPGTDTLIETPDTTG